MINTTENRIKDVIKAVTNGRDLENEPITFNEAVSAASDLYMDALNKAKVDTTRDVGPLLPIEPLSRIYDATGPDEVKAIISGHVEAHGEAIAEQKRKIDSYIGVVSGALTAAVGVGLGGGNPAAIAGALGPVVEVLRDLGGGGK